jgi:hypothetical protein
MRKSVGYLVVAFGSVLSVSAGAASPDCSQHVLYLPGSPCSTVQPYEREPEPAAVPRVEVTRATLEQVASADAVNRQLDTELINLSIDREMATAGVATSAITVTSAAPTATPAAAVELVPVVTPVATSPVIAGWSSESPGLQLTGASLFYRTTDVTLSHAAQTIRFRVQNPNVERASVTFDVDLLSERGRHYRRLVGAIVDSGGELTGPELELLPFEAGDHIVFVRIMGSMVCAEPQVATISGRYHDSCVPVHPRGAEQVAGRVYNTASLR